MQNQNDTLHISGIRETQKALYSYSQKLGDRVVVGALREGAKVTLKHIRASAPVYKGPERKGVIKGTLKKGFAVRKSKIHSGKQSATIGVYIALKKAKGGTTGRNPKDPFYGKFQEHGWRAGKKKRRVRGLKFISRAFHGTKTKAVQVIEKSVKAGAEIVKQRTAGLS